MEALALDGQEETRRQHRLDYAVAVGIAIWLLTGERDVDAGYESRVRTLVWAAVLIFAGYGPTFGLAFSRPSGFLVTLLREAPEPLSS